MSYFSSYDEYISDRVAEIPFLNVEDACFGIAFGMALEANVPAGLLNKKQTKSLNELEWDDEDIGNKVQPLCEWLVNNVCKSIENKEIYPVVVSRTVLGVLVTKETYVKEDDIYRWMECRGLQGRVYIDADYEEKLWDDMFKVHENINNVSELITYKIKHHNEEIPKQLEGFEESRNTALYLENLKLKEDIEKPKVRPKDRQNMHTERHAINREKVLGAALAVLAKYPDQCKNNTGNIEATKVRTLIEEKALLFWPETGEPSLSTDKIERLIREWLKKTGE